MYALYYVFDKRKELDDTEAQVLSLVDLNTLKVRYVTYAELYDLVSKGIKIVNIKYYKNRKLLRDSEVVSLDGITGFESVLDMYSTSYIKSDILHIGMDYKQFDINVTSDDMIIQSTNEAYVIWMRDIMFTFLKAGVVGMYQNDMYLLIKVDGEICVLPKKPEYDTQFDNLMMSVYKFLGDKYITSWDDCTRNQFMRSCILE